jgi:hypothetical protein
VNDTRKRNLSINFKAKIANKHFYSLVYLFSFIYRLWTEASTEAIKLKAISTLSPLQAYSKLQNQTLSKDGFTSGADALFTSSPLRAIYEICNQLNIEAITSLQIHIVSELIFQNLILIFVIKKISRVQPAAILYTLSFFNLFQITSPINLANWGIIYGWNYGYAYSIAILSIVLAAQKKTGAMFLVITILLSIHFTVGIITSGLCLLVIIQKNHGFKMTKLDSVWIVTSIPFLIYSIQQISYTSTDLTKQYNQDFINRIKMFQVHLFVDLFDPNKLEYFVPFMLQWSAIFFTLLTIIRQLKKQIFIFKEFERVLHSIFVASMAACIYSQFKESNSTAILLAFHRLSILVPYLFIVLILPLLFNGSLKIHKTATYTAIAIMFIHVAGYGRLSNWISLVLCTGLIYLNLKNFPKSKNTAGILMNSLILMEVTFVGYLSVLFILFSSPSLQLASIVLAVIAFLAVYKKHFFTTLNSEFRLSTNQVGVLVFVILLFGLQANIKTHLQYLQQKSVIVNSYYELAEWSKLNTEKDALFLLPLNDQIYGWESFSQRASVGKPLIWLHYSILYSRNYNDFLESEEKVSLLGVDLQSFVRKQQPNLDNRDGDLLLRTLYNNYAKLDSGDLIGIARELKVNYLVTEGRELQDKELILVFSYENYRIYKFSN